MDKELRNLARKILHEHCTKNNDCFLPGQVKWILDAMIKFRNLTIIMPMKKYVDEKEDYDLDNVIETLKDPELSSFDLERCIEQLKIINQRTIYWGIDDFRIIGMENCEHEKAVYERMYDESKYPESIALMIKRHDSDFGINNITVREYLAKMCRK